MAADVKVVARTPNLDRAIKFVQESDKVTRVAANKLLGDLLTAYSKGSNLSDKSSNKKLTSDYSDKKTDSGRNPIRDLNLSGRLTQSFGVKKEKKNNYTVGPRGSDEQAKMQGNIEYDRNLMKIGRSYRADLNLFVFGILKNGRK